MIIKIEFPDEFDNLWVWLPAVVSPDPDVVGKKFAYRVICENPILKVPGWEIVDKDSKRGLWVYYLKPEGAEIEERTACLAGCCVEYIPSASDLARAIGEAIVASDWGPDDADATIKIQE